MLKCITILLVKRYKCELCIVESRESNLPNFVRHALKLSGKYLSVSLLELKMHINADTFISLVYISNSNKDLVNKRLLLFEMSEFYFTSKCITKQPKPGTSEMYSKHIQRMNTNTILPVNNVFFFIR